MAKIDGFDIPAEILQELERMLRAAPDKAILEYAHDVPELAKGFRPGSKRSIIPVRKRLLGMFDTDSEIDPVLLAILAMGGLAEDLTGHLSDVLVEQAVDALAVIYGRNRILAALLVDYRLSVRELAMEVLGGDAELAKPSLKEAREELRSLCGTLIDRLQEGLDAGADAGAAEGPAEPAAGEVTRLREKVAELDLQLKNQEARGANEKALRKKLDVLRRQNEQLEKKAREEKKEIDRERHARNELREQHRKEHEARAALEQELESRVEQRVAAELASLRQSWLRKPVAVEKEAQALRRSREDDELRARAEQALERQAAADRHSGNMAALRKRVAELRAVRDRVRTARADALHPLSELGQVDSALTAEIARLEAVTGPPGAPGSPFIGNMLALVRAVRSEDELVRLKDILDHLSDLDALAAAELQDLYRAYHEQMSRLYAAFTPKVVRREKRPDDPVWRLRTAIEENQPMIVILDGHNVVHLLPNLFGQSYADGEPGKDTRQTLVEQVLGIFRRSANCRAQVFFDGPSRSTRAHADNVHEVYSGGGDAEHRADDAILEYLEYCCRKMSAMPRLLVTDDRDLRAKAGELGAKCMPVPQFGAFLEEMAQ